MSDILKSCPFCQKPLTVRAGVNAYGRCDTPSCWMEARKIALPLDDPEQVRAWNRRASESTVAALRAEVERLIRERDEADKSDMSARDMLNDLEAEIERLTKALEPSKGWNPTHRHVKRGSSYQIVAHARLQTERPLEDNRDVIVYEGEDGAVWVRPYHEFHDGRFEQIAARALDRSPGVESGK